MDIYIPKHAIRVTPKDALRCSVWSKGASYDMYVRYIILLLDGSVIYNSQFTNQPGSFVTTTGEYPLTDGWLLSVSLRSAVSGYSGYSYGLAEIVRQEDGTNYGQRALVQGMLSQTRSLSWPGYNPVSSLDTGRNPDNRIVNVTGGTQMNIDIEQNSWSEIQIMKISFTTSSAAANRRMVLIIDNGTDGGIVWRYAVNYLHPASTSRTYAFSFGCGAYLNYSSYFYIPMPLLMVRAGYRIRTAIENLQVNDLAIQMYLMTRKVIET